jgi:glycosyltransferase involved in cell wall biosynthesis
MRALRRWSLRLEDWARTGSLSRLKSVARRIGSLLWAPDSRVATRSLYLVTWHPIRDRVTFVSKTLKIAERRKSNYSDAARLTCSILLKQPVANDERGMLLVSFEPELAKLANLKLLLDLEREYAITFVPTWQPFYSEALFSFAARATRPYWIMPSATADQKLCADLGPLCRPLPFQASSWVSRARYSDVHAVKTIDLLMLANFSSYKRHWRLFEAIPQLPASITIALAGRPYSGRTAESLLIEADAFGVRDRIKLYENPTDQELAQLLASARLLCALSHKEGSYIAVAEALMAGTPVAMFSDAVVGSKEYISEQTGFLLNRHQPLGPQLLSCLNRVDQLRPADWAAANISAEANCVRLNAVLRNDSNLAGESWTVDLAAFYCRHFEFEYSDSVQEEVFKSAYLKMKRDVGLEIVRPAET